MEVAVSLTFLCVKSLGRKISSISRSPRCWVVWTEDRNPSKTPLNVNFFILVRATFQSSFSFFGSMMTNFSIFHGTFTNFFSLLFNWFVTDKDEQMNLCFVRFEYLFDECQFQLSCLFSRLLLFIQLSRVLLSIWVIHYGSFASQPSLPSNILIILLFLL